MRSLDEPVYSPAIYGTLVPLSIVRKKGTLLDDPRPTRLLAYDGLGVTVDPYSDATLLARLERSRVPEFQPKK